MKFFSTFFYAGFASGVRVFSGFLSSKVIAVLLGPMGVGYIGQFYNVTSFLISFCNGLWNTGVVAISADEKDRASFPTRVATLFKLVLFSAVLIGFLVFCFSSQLSDFSFHEANYAYLFRILGVLLVILCVNQFFISLLNGRRETKKYAIASISGSIFSLGMTVLLIYFWRLNGALIAITISGTGIIFFSAYLLSRCSWFRWSMLAQKFDKKLLKSFLSYSLVGLSTAIVLPITQLFVRSYLARHLSWTEAGYWQALGRLSQAYLNILTTALTVYFLPKFSSLEDRSDLRRELKRGLIYIIIFMIVATLLIYLLRFFLIEIAYTKQFYPLASLFKYQLVGDFFQIISWLFGYLLLAKAKVKALVTTEIIFGASYCGLVVVLTRYMGLSGAVLAMTLNYFIYLLVIGFIAWKTVLID